MKRSLLLLSGISLVFLNFLQAQPAFTTEEYDKALWMTTRFYGGQRSGENNWLLYNHLPEGVSEQYRGTAFIEDQDTDGYDLSGGWHDCGDHVKFGQTEFYSAYMLLKGFYEFPEGYDDYYSQDYSGYKSGGDWSWETGTPEPNGIPDVIDEVKHATDYFIKCARNSSTFYYQIGEGDKDHKEWVTATMMQTLPESQGGQPRTAYKNPSGASMASFCGATLALMSRVYRKFDPAYADLCLQHAKYAYDYAKDHPGTADTGDGPFYDPNSNWKDDYATMCAELFWATGDEGYKTEALSFSIHRDNAGSYDITGNSWGFNYNDNGDIAIYNLALLGKENAASVFSDIVNSLYLGNVQADGQYNGGDTDWGPLRFNANTALMVALWQKLQGTDDTPHQFIYDNIDYIFGNNSANQSFVVGFGDGPLHPHHRNLFLRDDNPENKNSMTIPAKNQQFGLMVGGTRNPGSFNDDLVSYTHTEGGIDYNACLVGALAFIKKCLNPVDTNKFGNTTPDLGDDQSICGISGITLDAQVETDGVKTFTWYQDDNIVVDASATENTYYATSPGTYRVVLDSAGEWSTESSMEISGELPDIDLGPDTELCNPAYLVLRAGVDGPGFVYEWSSDNDGLLNTSEDTLFVREAGTYTLTVSASGCPDKSDEITVTSNLPAVTDDYTCNGTDATLTVDGSHSDFGWYDAETGGTLLGTGLSFTTNEPGTYYAQDESSFSVTTGPEYGGHSFTDENTGNGSSDASELQFEVLEQLTLNAVTFDIKSWDDTEAEIHITQDGNDIPGSPFTVTGEDGGSGGIWVTVRAELNAELEPGTYVITSNRIRNYFNAGDDFYPQNYENLIILQDNNSSYNQWNNPNNYGGYFDWEITAGNGCGRIPAVVTENCVTGTKEEGSQKHVIFPNPSENTFTIKGLEGKSFEVYDSYGRQVYSGDKSTGSAFGSELHKGIYFIVIRDSEGTVLERSKIIKQ